MISLNSTASMLAASLLLTTSSFIAPANADGNFETNNWLGPYFGLHGGMNQRSVDFDRLQDAEEEGLKFGVHGGYNFRMNAIVLGIEGDISTGDSKLEFKATDGSSANLSYDWSSTLRGRIGLPIGPVMLYATAGWGWTKSKLIERTQISDPTSKETTISGPVIGAGAEAFILPGVMARAEFLNIDYTNEDYSFSDVIVAKEGADTSDQMFRLGISIKMN